MQVYLAIGGCWGDEHVIAVYGNEKAAEDRAEKENEECKGLEAYVESWAVLDFPTAKKARPRRKLKPMRVHGMSWTIPRINKHGGKISWNVSKRMNII